MLGAARASAQTRRPELKITRIVPWIVNANAMSGGWGEFIFVQVDTDEDTTGWGEITSTSPAANRVVARALRETNALLVGDDATRIGAIWHKLFRHFTFMGSRGAASHCLSGIDIALWDIRGKSLGVPVYELLGGALREDVPLYTHPEQSCLMDKGALRDEITRLLDAGFDALKFDPFPFEGDFGGMLNYVDGNLSKSDERIAVEITATVREIVGPEVEVLIDAHGRFNVPTAIRLSNTLHDAAAIDWFEEPVPVESHRALAQVREATHAPICVGERLHTRWDFVPIFENGLADFVMPDVTWAGGVSELMRIAAMAEAYFVPVSPHDASGPLNVMAGAQVMLAVPNVDRVETAHFGLAKYNAFLAEPLDVKAGRLRVPRRPGLGLDLNLEFMRSVSVEGFDDRTPG